MSARGNARDAPITMRGIPRSRHGAKCATHLERESLLIVCRRQEDRMWRLSISIVDDAVILFFVFALIKDLKGLKEVCSCLCDYERHMTSFIFEKKILCSALIEVTTYDSFELVLDFGWSLL